MLHFVNIVQGISGTLSFCTEYESNDCNLIITGNKYLIKSLLNIKNLSLLLKVWFPYEKIKFKSCHGSSYLS